MKIYYTTHSETTDNAAGIASGWKNVGLSELGIQQSKEIGKRFKDIKIDLICASDLKRAKDTVKIAFEDKIPVINDKRLREISYGDLNGHTTKEVYAIKAQKVREPFPGGESFEQAAKRVQDFIKELKTKHDDKTVLIVGHRATHYGLDTLAGSRTLEECANEQFKWQPWWEYEI